MNNDVFYMAYISLSPENQRYGMVIRIPVEKNKLPGDRIKALTEAVNDLNTNREIKLRTEPLVTPPLEMETRPLSDYLWADGSFNASRFKRHLLVFIDKSAPHLFIPHPGMPVLGADLIGRENTLLVLQEAIANGSSCHLRAPRRYGKTSLLMRLSQSWPGAVHLDLMDVCSLAGFLKSLLLACMRKPDARTALMTLEAFSSLPDNSTAFNSHYEQVLTSRGTTIIPLIRETFRVLSKSSIVLLIDEFSIFLRTMLDQKSDELSGFLDMFHAQRTNSAMPLVAVFAGSAGLSAYIEFHNMQEQFADLIAVDVPPISAAKAAILAEELFYGMGRSPSPAVIERVVDLNGQDESIPYFIHALVHVVAQEAGLRKEVREEDVNRGYQDGLMGPSGNIVFRDFLLRECTYPPPNRACASIVLKQLSRQFPRVVKDNDLQGLCSAGCEFKKLMTCLQEDYDLIRVDDGWRMRSKVLADRWRLGDPWLTGGA